MSTTDTWEKLARPEIRAAQMVVETTWVEITVGTEKQIKYAKDLRSEFIKRITNRDNIANLRYAVIKQERGEHLSSIEAQALARDAWDRRTIAAINTDSAKAILDWFVSTPSKVRSNDAITKYAHIIQYPRQWTFVNGGWCRTN